jgi:hypothetical protein
VAWLVNGTAIIRTLRLSASDRSCYVGRAAAFKAANPNAPAQEKGGAGGESDAERARAIPTKRHSRSALLLGIVALGVVLAAGLAALAAASQGQVRRLPDGSTLRLEGVTYGKVHPWMHGTWWQKWLYPVVPPAVRNWSGLWAPRTGWLMGDFFQDGKLVLRQAQLERGLGTKPWLSQGKFAVLGFGQLHRLLAPAHLAARQVDHQIADPQHRRRWAWPGGRAAQDSADPSQQLPHMERLGEIVIGAQIQRRHLRLRRIGRRQQDHRHCRPLGAGV